MAYEFVPRKEYKEAAKIARSFIDQLQKELKNHLTFDKSLIGSVKSRLVTRNGNQNPFDFDYQLEIKKIKDKKYENTNQILEIFLTKINQIKKYYPSISKKIDNGKKVFKIKIDHSIENKVWFNIEISILRLINNEMNIIYFDKKTNKKIYNKEKFDFANNKELKQKFLMIRQNPQLWLDFKKRYLKKKNSKEYVNRKSISIYKETINEY